MNRRDFLLSLIAVTVVPGLALAEAGTAMPPIEYVWIPPLASTADPLGQRGYCGGAIEVRGKRYSVLYSFSDADFSASDQDEMKRQMRQMIDEKLRSIFLGAA